jgi:hypothetical protein
MIAYTCSIRFPPKKNTHPNLRVRAIYVHEMKVIVFWDVTAGSSEERCISSRFLRNDDND